LCCSLLIFPLTCYGLALIVAQTTFLHFPLVSAS
jgi:hypothetical protein